MTHTMPRPETLAGLQAEGAFYVFDIPALAARGLKARGTQALRTAFQKAPVAVAARVMLATQPTRWTERSTRADAAAMALRAASPVSRFIMAAVVAGTALRTKAVSAVLAVAATAKDFYVTQIFTDPTDDVSTDYY